MKSISYAAGQKTLGIPELLRDARLLRSAWQPAERQLSLRFECLRCNADGSALPNRTVELRLGGVAVVAAAYDPMWPEQRPSDLALPSGVTLNSLVPWPLPDQEVSLRIDSKSADEQILLAARVHRIVGDPADDPHAVKHVSFDFSVPGGTATGMLWIACDAVTPWAQGQVIELTTWTEQFLAWWRHWGERSPVQQIGQESGPGPRIEVAHSGRHAEHSADAPFVAASASIPGELLQPLRVWFEAPFAGAWRELARAYPDLDATEEARAETLRRAFADFEPWSFGREVAVGWIEGPRAHARVLGVAYYPPAEGEPASARLVAWNFELRRRSGHWQIHRHVEQDANFGANLPAWAQQWPAGPVRDALDEEMAALRH